MSPEDVLPKLVAIPRPPRMSRLFHQLSNIDAIDIKVIHSITTANNIDIKRKDNNNFSNNTEDDFNVDGGSRFSINRQTSASSDGDDSGSPTPIRSRNTSFISPSGALLAKTIEDKDGNLYRSRNASVVSASGLIPSKPLEEKEGLGGGSYRSRNGSMISNAPNYIKAENISSPTNNNSVVLEDDKSTTSYAKDGSCDRTDLEVLFVANCVNTNNAGMSSSMCIDSLTLLTILFNIIYAYYHSQEICC